VRLCVCATCMLYMLNFSLTCATEGKDDITGYTQLALSSCGEYLATVDEFPTFTLKLWSIQERAIVAEVPLRAPMFFSQCACALLREERLGLRMGTGSVTLVTTESSRSRSHQAPLPKLTEYTLGFNPNTWMQLFTAADSRATVWAVEQCRNQHFLVDKCVCVCVCVCVFGCSV
jgi:hypothetical protein